LLSPKDGNFRLYDYSFHSKTSAVKVLKPWAERSRSAQRLQRLKPLMQQKVSPVEELNIYTQVGLVTLIGLIVGLVPLLRASGAGAASRFSISIVVAGMLIGTLFILPAVYTVLAEDHLAATRSARVRGIAQVS
jgi:hypothetical protein